MKPKVETIHPHSYRSARTGYRKDLPKALMAQIREALIAAGFDTQWTKGQVQDFLLAQTWEGDRLLINQLEPMFLYLAVYGEIWTEEEEMDE
jgi:hypothetical protein